ncbi:MAG: DUF411 domain-containing protein [Loktanella sp.]|nr:DUF411 domain-containing protein [Loktanella sp.]
MINRRIFLASLAGTVASTSKVLAVSAPDADRHIRVVRSPDCGCCGAWITHLEENGFIVEDVLSTDIEATKDQYAVPMQLRSCHTGIIAGYVIEGHVPATDIIKLLEERPEADGLAVPGMPIGSPGMEMGDRTDAFDVILWSGGNTTVFSEYKG